MYVYFYLYISCIILQYLIFDMLGWKASEINHGASQEFGTMLNLVHVISALLGILVELHPASHGDSGNIPVPWTCD